MNKSPSLLGLSRDALQSQFGLCSAYLRGVHTVRQCQVEQIAASVGEYDGFLKQLTAVQDFDGLHGLQAAVLNTWSARVALYWSELSRAMNALQLELCGAAQDCGGQATQDLLQGAEQWQAHLAEEAGALLRPMLGAQSPFAFMAQGAVHSEEADALSHEDHNGSDYARTQRAGARAARGTHAG